jgi:hypothetical protein
VRAISSAFKKWDLYKDSTFLYGRQKTLTNYSPHNQGASYLKQGRTKNEKLLLRDTCHEYPLSLLMRLLYKMAEILIIQQGEYFIGDINDEGMDRRENPF